MADIDYRLVGRLSIVYMMSLVTEVLRNSPIDFLDLLIVTAVSEANHRKGDGADEAQPGLRGISRNAVSRRLNVPLETVRRRVAGLILKQILAEQRDGLIFSAGNDAGIGSNRELDELNLRNLRQLFRALRDNGITLD